MVDYSKIYQQRHKTDSKYQKNNWGLWSLKHWINRFNFKSFVELGCGNGKLLQVLSKQGIKCTGIDVISGIYKSLNYTYIQQDITQGILPFTDNTFDLAGSFDCLEHLDPKDINHAIIELVRISKQQVVYIPHYDAKNLHLIIKDRFWWQNKLENLTNKHWIALPLVTGYKAKTLFIMETKYELNKS